MNQESGEATHRDFACSNCGANLKFAPGTESLECPYCGHQQEIARGDAAIEELDLGAALEKAKSQPAGELVEGANEVSCEGCGARIVVSGHADQCPYCASPVVLVPAADDETIAPESVLPFAIERSQALQRFRDWVKSLWFAPNDLAARAAADKIDGVYMPYWTYDSSTSTKYEGRRGDHYTETETQTDSAGNTVEHQVQKTRWTSVSGTVKRHFDDVLVCASNSLPRSLVRGLEPWDLDQLAPFEPAFLSGFQAERYSLSLEEGFELAKEKMAPVIDDLIRSDIGGDDQEIKSRDTSHSSRTFKHVLLPLWISAYRYQEKVFRFIVNPRTGKVSGERPYSVIKIVLAILAVVAVVGGLVWLGMSSK